MIEEFDCNLRRQLTLYPKDEGSSAYQNILKYLP